MQGLITLSMASEDIFQALRDLIRPEYDDDDDDVDDDDGDDDKDGVDDDDGDDEDHVDDMVSLSTTMSC